MDFRRYSTPEWTVSIGWHFGRECAIGMWVPRLPLECTMLTAFALGILHGIGGVILNY